MRGRKLRCLSVLDSVCGNLVQSGSASIGCVYTIYRRLEFLRLMSSQDFFLPSESYDLIFLKARIAILCTKGFEIMDLSELVTTLSTPCFYWAADLSSTVSRVSQFHNAMIHAMKSSLNGASHVVLWACSVPAKTSSFFAMMVNVPSVTPSICHLTHFLRIRVVCKPPR